MKTTLILRDDLVRRAKARAAMRGQPLSRYVEESLERAIIRDEEGASATGDWIRNLPKLSGAAGRELRAALDRDDLRPVDLEMWR